MGLKVIHIDRKKLDLENEARSLWENVLKPKWEKRCSVRAEKLMTELRRDGKALTSGFTTQNETIESGEKLKIVIEVDGNKLNITCINKNEVKKR